MKQIIQNERGVLTIDFIFASMLVFGFSAIIFSFSMALSVVEVVQYISFVTARNYSLAHLNEEEQKRRGEVKFQELSTNPVLTSLINSGWFEIRQAQIADFNAEFGATPASDSELFYGARIPFGAPILYKRIPMIGTTASDPDQFTANVQSFLAREPSFEECQSLIEQRAQLFQNLSTTVRYSFDPGAVAIIMDNGC